MTVGMWFHAPFCKLCRRQAKIDESADTGGENLTLRRVFTLARRCWPYYRPQLKHLVTYLSLNALMGVLILVGTLVGNDLLFNKVINAEPLTSTQTTLLFLDDTYASPEGELLSPNQRSTVLFVLLLLGFVYAALLSASFIGTGSYMTWIYQRINQDLRRTMIQRAEALSLQYHAFARTGDAIYRVYQDSATITNVLQSFIITPLRAVSWALFGAFILTLFNPWLGLLALCATVPLVLLLWKFTPRVGRHALASRRANSSLTSNIQETFAAIKVIKANQAEGQVLADFDRDSNTALDYAFKLRVDIVTMSVAVVMFALLLLLLAEYTMAAWTISERSTFLAGAFTFVGFAVWNLGAFRAASENFVSAGESTSEIVALWIKGLDLAIGLDRAFYLLEVDSAIEESQTPLPFPDRVSQVTWNDVHFAYADKPVLRGVTLQAHRGQIVAIVGATGSGKTTLMSLLLRLYDVDSGNLRIDDSDVRELELDALRGNVAIALQKNVLFTATVRDNIAYGLPDISDADLEKAARIACADEFIQDMQEGYATELGERGSKLSTGQRQRLSIARAVARDTPILILDEPTASLDAQTEHSVLANLHEWGRDRIVFLVTHRLSTVRQADKIAFLENGVIAESGSHDELMAYPEGRYRRFVTAELVGAANE